MKTLVCLGDRRQDRQIPLEANESGLWAIWDKGRGSGDSDKKRVFKMTQVINSVDD
jgi:hypothetical protein